ncbi:hypothetical protein ACN20G_32925 (plasmid) [Streptomyces sp. BI20]|uniref:hypothetical protein n=1 Tax=Streptomyces sp. BI20 TaxID=3403460 RepID=UPI003C78FF01
MTMNTTLWASGPGGTGPGDDAPEEAVPGEAVLAEDEERVYRALARDRSAGADRLRAELGMRQPEFTRALERLRELGFVRGAPPGELPHPVPADRAVRALVHHRTAELHRRAAELERLRQTADALTARLVPDRTALGPDLELFTGRPHVVRRIGELLAAARHEVAILDRPPYAMPTRPEEYRPDEGMDGLLARGVRVRVVVGTEALDRPGRLRELAPMMAAGLRVRAAPAVPTKLLLVDGRTALLPPTGDADPADTALVVGGGLLAPALVGLFEAVWQGALPFGGPDEAPAGEPGRELLGLMAGGLKDEAIARQLGVHVHTARRRITAMLAELGAETRFQAGARAALRGWL